MKDLYDVLRQKEQEYKRLAREIEALRITASLLAEEKEHSGSDSAKVPVALAANASSGSGTRAAEDTASRWP